VATIESELGFARLTDAVAELGKFVPKVSPSCCRDEFDPDTCWDGARDCGRASSNVSFQYAKCCVSRFRGFPKKTFPLVFVHRSSESSPGTRAFIEFMVRHKLKGEQSRETVG